MIPRRTAHGYSAAVVISRRQRNAPQPARSPKSRSTGISCGSRTNRSESRWTQECLPVPLDRRLCRARDYAFGNILGKGHTDLASRLMCTARASLAQPGQVQVAPELVGFARWPDRWHAIYEQRTIDGVFNTALCGGAKCGCTPMVVGGLHVCRADSSCDSQSGLLPARIHTRRRAPHSSFTLNSLIGS